MTRLHLWTSGGSMQGVLDWLAAECGVTPGDVASTIGRGDPGTPADRIDGVPAIAVSDVPAHVGPADAVIVAGPAIERAVGHLLAIGIRNIYNGNEMIRRRSPVRQFVSAASEFYIGPSAPTCDGAPIMPAGRFAVMPIVARQAPPHKLFIVNSMPKSGTVWMTAMLEDLLGISAQQQITVSHVADIEEDWNKENNHGALALVRDLRDVVVSWFHDVGRADRALGFPCPRYPDVAAFYHELFLGTVLGTSRFYFGDFERWLNLVSAHYVPIIRYEDMVADTAACLRKVTTFWRVETTPGMVEEIVQRHDFTSMAKQVEQRPGFVADMVKQGHLRSGRPGAWCDELPADIARDIDRRFAGYQRRLGYIQP